MKIAICGSAPSSRMLTPFSDKNWEIWACSPVNYDFPRVDAWFELHSLDRKFCPENEPYRKRLEAHPRVYIAAKDDRLPNANVFDPAPLVAKYGEWFFSSSLAWMMARAIESKPTHIGIWGVDMSAVEEYGYQRAGMHFFMWVAQQQGIEILLPPQSDLAMAPPLYAFKEQWPMYWKMKAFEKELQDRISKAGKLEQQNQQQRIALQGAFDFREYIVNTYLRPHGPQVTPPPTTVVIPDGTV